MLINLCAFVLLIHWSEITQGKKEQPENEISDDWKSFNEHRSRYKREDRCVDEINYCNIYKPYCKHSAYKDYLKDKCKKTCGLCRQVCRDRLSCCAEIKESCEDKSLAALMKYHCAKTCAMCAVEPTPPPPPPPTTSPPRTELPIDQGDVECGKRGVHYRIVGGTNALPGNWPWQVTMDYTGESSPHWCGGSIVTPEWIVTAAHCFAYGDDIQNYIITAGEYDLNSLEGYEQNITVDKIIKHPKYDSFNNHDYDVALVKLKTPIKYNNHVRPICLAKVDFEPETLCYVTGWGHTSEGGSIPQILQQAQVPLVSRETCQEGYKDLGYTITKRMRCAGYAEGEIDACQGDSGGPLVCIRDHKWYLMGVVSWGIGCARKGRYGVYADMMEVKYWVQKTISQDN